MKIKETKKMTRDKILELITLLTKLFFFGLMSCMFCIATEVLIELLSFYVTSVNEAIIALLVIMGMLCWHIITLLFIKVCVIRKCDMCVKRERVVIRPFGIEEEKLVTVTPKIAKEKETENL